MSQHIFNFFIFNYPSEQHSFIIMVIPLKPTLVVILIFSLRPKATDDNCINWYCSQQAVLALGTFTTYIVMPCVETRWTPVVKLLSETNQIPARVQAFWDVRPLKNQGQQLQMSVVLVFLISPRYSVSSHTGSYSSHIIIEWALWCSILVMVSWLVDAQSPIHNYYIVTLLKPT